MARARPLHRGACGAVRIGNGKECAVMARFAPKNTLPALGGLLGAALLIGYAPAAAEGAMRGLSACGRVILPAVFPFLAVSVFLAGAPGGAFPG